MKIICTQSTRLTARLSIALIMLTISMLAFTLPAQAQWRELGGPNALAANAPINTMCSDAAGNIYVAGFFFDGQNRYYVAKYNGTSWSKLGGTAGVPIVMAP